MLQFCVILLTLVIAMFTPAFAQGHYADVNGLKLYYEIHGQGGTPLVLLHGGGSTLNTSFGAVLAELAKGRQVIAFDQQGHGRTADIAGRPFTFEQSADDAAQLLRQLKVEQADFYGYSNGGTIAVQVAIRHPKLVRKLVLMSTLTRRDGSPPEFWAGFKTATLQTMPAELREEYQKVAPEPKNLQSFFDKSVKRMAEFRDIPDATMKAITAPTLIIAGDRDVILPEHAVAQLRLLAHAQLAILPGVDHMRIVKEPALQLAIIPAFLDAE